MWPIRPTDQRKVGMYTRAPCTRVITAMIAAGNIAATQFHAEKSGEIGLRVLANFATWDGV